MSKRLNFIIFGATGYTGKIVVNELALAAKKHEFTWGIAGRSYDKLKQVLNSVSTKNSIKLDNNPIITADILNLASIKEMCSQTMILINCVGPYRYYGEEIIKQCLNTNTHHIDFSGEPEYLETIQLKYNEEAKSKKLFIIGGCGFDSVVADIGVLFTRQNSKVNLESIESYLTLQTTGKYTFNYATWQSAIEGFASIKNLKQVRKKLFEFGLPTPKKTRKTNLLGYYYDQLLQKYCVPFLGSDKSVIERTQLFNYKLYNQIPFHYMPYMTVNSLYGLVLLMAYGFIFNLMIRFKYGRYLLLKYYKLFSNGIISKSNDKLNLNDASFRFEFRGYDSMNKNVIITEVTGPEPGYLAASRIIVSCSIILFNELDKITVKGGVMTPGSAFFKTSLLNMLENDGIEFKIVQSDKLTKKTKQLSNL